MVYHLANISQLDAHTIQNKKLNILDVWRIGQYYGTLDHKLLKNVGLR